MRFCMQPILPVSYTHLITPDGKPNIKLSENSTVKYDYMDGKSNLFNAYLDGKMLDDNTCLLYTSRCV